jgi:hypothetical protein
MSFHFMSLSFNFSIGQIMSLNVISCQYEFNHVIACHNYVIYHVVSCVSGLFRPSFTKVGGRAGPGKGRIKYVFLGLRRQLCYQAKGKNKVGYIL